MLSLFLLSCTGPEAVSDSEAVCESACALPFPSTAMMAEDTTTDSGWRVAIPELGLPVDIDGVE